MNSNQVGTKRTKAPTEKSPIEILVEEREMRKPKSAKVAETSVAAKKKILFVASEARPFIATGGLADVIGSLPQALAKDPDYDVRVVLPLYADIKPDQRRKLSNQHVALPDLLRMLAMLFYLDR